MNKLEFAQEMIKIARQVREYTYKNESNSRGDSLYGEYCKKYKLEQIIKNCYEVAGDSIKLLIETSDIRKLNDEDYNSFKDILIIVSDKLQ
jgi:hypothetical protein